MSSNFTNNGNFTWWNTTDSASSNLFTTATTSGDNIIFSGTFDITTAANNSNWCQIKTADKDWMPYPYFEYEPKWHKKFARYKLQMEKMWDN